MSEVENQDEDLISRGRIILREICENKGFAVVSVLTELCVQSKDMISEYARNIIAVTSTLKLKAYELFEDEHYTANHSKH